MAGDANVTDTDEYCRTLRPPPADGAESASQAGSNRQSKPAPEAVAASAQGRFRSVKPLTTVLVKPAGPDCNLTCTYCFYLAKAALFSDAPVHRMSLELLEQLIRQMLRSGEAGVSFAWQGGEPTLMGLPFYQKAVSFQQRYGWGKTVGNGLQTNGLLLDRNWARFLKQYNFLVGLSLDGPEQVHDRYRLAQGRKGTWHKVADRARLLLDTGVAVNALTVVTDYSVQFPAEIYEFHKNLGLTYQQYIPCRETNPQNPSQAAAFSVPPQAYGEFLCVLFDLWLQDFKAGQPTTSVRYFDSVFYNYVGLAAPECTLLPECGTYVVVEHNGDVFSCDFFVQPEWKLGNITTANLSDLLNSSGQKQFGCQKSALPDLCKSCQWLKYCFGACPRDRSYQHQKQNQSYFCPSYQLFFAHADVRLRQLAKNWQAQQAPGPTATRSGHSVDYQVGRNDPCPCGSGRKFKKCCGE